jgi:hypothetical protein
MERVSLWQEFLQEIQDDEKEYIRYLAKDIAFLKELREHYLDEENWEMEELLSSIIDEEAKLLDDCKRRWINAQEQKHRLEKLRRTGSSHEQPRIGNEAQRNPTEHSEPPIQNSLFGQGD